MRLLPLLLSALSLTATLPAAPPEALFKGKGLTVELVSEVTAVRPGEPFHAGIFIRHEGGSHTYWSNPGLAGVATRLEWSLPEGWKAGELEWPAPEKVKMAAINTHGYERDVLLMVKLTPPERLPDRTVTLKTMAAWMCCARTCHPGFCDLLLTLPVASGNAPAWHEKWHPVFARERLNHPVPATGWTFTAVRRDKHIILTGTPAAPGTAAPAQPVFMSLDNLICSHPEQIWKTTATGFEATLELSELPPPGQDRLRGLLTGKPGWRPDDSRAVVIDVPVR